MNIENGERCYFDKKATLSETLIFLQNQRLDEKFAINKNRLMYYDRYVEVSQDYIKARCADWLSVESGSLLPDELKSKYYISLNNDYIVLDVFCNEILHNTFEVVVIKLANDIERTK